MRAREGELPLSYVIRSWNVFHGRTSPPGRHAYLSEAVRLAVADEPDIVCLQEVPMWGLSRLNAWSGMATYGDETMKPALGLLPLPPSASRRLTDLHHGFIRSALAGQANVVLVSPRIEVLDHVRLVLNDKAFRRAQARALGLGLRARLAWAWERRVCQALRLRLPDGRVAHVLNLHASNIGADRRIAEAEVSRAAAYAERSAGPDELVVLAGDFNVRPDRSGVLAELVSEGFSSPGPGIDHVLVRGADASPLQVWPDDRRRFLGRLLSDHPPVELTIE
jgi:endonuclease/exonuclease/phosphatase family metal-dependent hydrolase